MKLLPKVVKSSHTYQDGNPVPIDNTVRIARDISPEIPEGEQAEPHVIQERERLETELREQISREIELKRESLMQEISRIEAEALASAEARAAKIKADAEQNAEEIRLKAESEAAQLKENSRKQGYDDGFANGRETSISQCETFVRAAAQFLAEINAKKDAYYISHEEETEALILDMVKQITLQELKTDSGIIFEMLKEAAKRFRNCDYLKISFAKGDVSENVVSDLKFIKKVVGDIPDVQIEILTEAPEGTLILDNGSEIIDASVPTQLDFLKEIMENSKRK